MPFSTMPKEAFDLWETVYNNARENGDDEKTAARKAYGALRRAGWYKGDDGKWHKKAQLETFSMRIERASYDKATGEKRWRAVASDTELDSMGDKMSLDLFRDFIDRAVSGEKIPDKYSGKFWNGGMPYLSISHYPDLEGKVPGITEKLYIDGNRLKAKGKFLDNKYGEACFRAVCEDLYSNKVASNEDRIRISIAFLDYKHRHLSNGFIFERKSIDDVCPECLLEIISGEYTGREYLKGHLVHLALTRVPVNKRTEMEVDRSMSAKTRYDDAASIIGEELAEELEKEAKLVGKSEALVIKSDEDSEQSGEVENNNVAVIEESSAVNVDVECCNKIQGDEVYSIDDFLVEDAVLKKERDCAHPASHYLVVEDKEKPTTWHLRVRDCEGKLDHRLMGQAWAALHEGFRGNKYEGPQKEQALRKLKQLYKEEGLSLPSKSDIDEDRLDTDRIIAEIRELKAQISEKHERHVLDSAFDEFKHLFDTVLQSDKSSENKMDILRAGYERLGQEIVNEINKIATPLDKKEITVDEKIARSVSDAIAPIAQKVDMIIAQLQSQQGKSVFLTQPKTPQPRSISPTLSMQTDVFSRKSSSSLRSILERTV